VTWQYNDEDDDDDEEDDDDDDDDDRISSEEPLACTLPMTKKAMCLLHGGMGCVGGGGTNSHGAWYGMV
jgi:hypothetical protein